MMTIVMTILKMMAATCVQQVWRQIFATTMSMFSQRQQPECDIIDNTCGLEIDNMQGDPSLQQIPVWRRKTIDLRPYGYDDSYVLLLIDSGAFTHVCPTDFGKGLTQVTR